MATDQPLLLSLSSIFGGSNILLLFHSSLAQYECNDVCVVVVVNVNHILWLDIVQLWHTVTVILSAVRKEKHDVQSRYRLCSMWPDKKKWIHCAEHRMAAGSHPDWAQHLSSAFLFSSIRYYFVTNKNRPQFGLYKYA